MGMPGQQEAKALASLLRQNALVRLSLINLPSTLDDHFARVAHALETNTSLEELNLVYSEGSKFLGDSNQDSLVSSVRDKNFTLKEIEFLHLPESERTDKALDTICKLEYYVKLNKLGRGVLFQEGSTQDQWVDFLVLGRHDLDAIFYALSLRPDLCM